MEIHALHHVDLKPLAQLGFTHSFWTVNIDTLIYTWISMAMLGIFVVYSRWAMHRPKNSVVYLVSSIINFFDNTLQEGFGRRDLDCVSYVVGLFFFTLFCNVCGLLPFVSEATTNINTTLAIALASFFYVQYQSIRVRKFAFFLKFLQPVAIFFPLNVIGQTSKIASLNFRLFGNILGGAIIWDLLYQLLIKVHVPFSIAVFTLLPACIFLARWKKMAAYKPLQNVSSMVMRLIQFVPSFLIVFGLFEGILHAFVISLLTSIYINNEVDVSGGGH